MSDNGAYVNVALQGAANVFLSRLANRAALLFALFFCTNQAIGARDGRTSFDAAATFQAAGWSVACYDLGSRASCIISSEAGRVPLELQFNSDRVLISYANAKSSSLPWHNLTVQRQRNLDGRVLLTLQRELMSFASEQGTPERAEWDALLNISEIILAATRK